MKSGVGCFRTLDEIRTKKKMINLRRYAEIHDWVGNRLNKCRTVMGTPSNAASECNHNRFFRPNLAVKLLRLLRFFEHLAKARGHKDERSVCRVEFFNYGERFGDDFVHVLPQQCHVER
jgi:hypothetical protein